MKFSNENPTTSIDKLSPKLTQRIVRVINSFINNNKDIFPIYKYYIEQLNLAPQFGDKVTFNKNINLLLSDEAVAAGSLANSFLLSNQIEAYFVNVRDFFAQKKPLIFDKFEQPRIQHFNGFLNYIFMENIIMFEEVDIIGLITANTKYK